MGVASLARDEDPWSDSAVAFHVTVPRRGRDEWSYVSMRREYGPDRPGLVPASGTRTKDGEDIYDVIRLRQSENWYFTKEHASILAQRASGGLESCGVNGKYPGLSTAQSAVIEHLILSQDEVSIDFERIPSRSFSANLRSLPPSST